MATGPTPISGPRALRVRGERASGRLHEYRLAIDGVETRAIEVEGDGPPALLLHGFCDSADTWRGVLDRLRYLGRAAIAYDLPGYGYAKPSRRGGNLLERQVEFTALAIERVAAASGRKVILAGNSLGGWTALRAAERQQLPVAGVVPVAPAGFELSPWFFRADRIPGLAPLVTFPAPLPEAVVRNMVGRAARRIAFGARERIDESWVRSFAFHNRDRRKLLHRFQDAKGVVAELDRPLDPTLVGIPAIVIWGERDLLCLPAGAAPLAAQLGAKLTMVPRCGHLPQVECPDVVVEAIEELAAGHRRRGLRGLAARL